MTVSRLGFISSSFALASKGYSTTPLAEAKVGEILCTLL